MVEAGSVDATTASFAASAALPSTAAIAPARLAGVPMPCGSGVRSTSRAARAPARDATSESVEFETPSQTTSTARSPGVAEATSAIASSLREWTRPRSQTPATQAAGVSSKWSRSEGALTPQLSQ